MAAKENRELKNSMFVDLFYEDESAEENDIALYNALHEEPLPEGTKIQKIRVDNVLYMNFKNDVSFGVGGKILVFAEHQSTINENMPLRSLMYIGRAYEQMIPIKSRYCKKMVPLPRPEFYTFYNGEKCWEKEKVLRLSDAFQVKDEDPMLDLSVKVININPDENHEMLDKCQVLKEYGQFVDLVRKFQKNGEPDACKRAIQESIRQGILADYLKKKGSEVLNMLIAEYDYDMDIEVQREEAMEEGLIKGQKQKLISQVCKKLQKDFTVSEIASMLEEDEDTIQRIYNAALRYAPEYDVDKIYDELEMCEHTYDTNKSKNTFK